MAIIKIGNPAIDLDAAEIPNLSANKITSGTFDNARISLDAAEIPNLDTAKITTGTLADARVPDLNASKITAGTIATARLGSGTASSSTFLRGDNTFASAGGDNTPSFFASKTDGNQTLNDSTATKVTFNTELYDTNSAYASNKFTVPSGEAGKYFFSTGINTYDAQGSLKRHIVYFYKNNSQASMANNDFGTNVMYQMMSFHSVVFDLSVGDYIEVYSLNDTHDGNSSVISSSSGKFETWFSAYKLII